MNVAWTLPLVMLLGTSQPAADAVPAVKEKFETVATFEVERKANDTVEFGPALDVTADGKGLIYLSDALSRLDLDTGREQILLSTEDLVRASVVGERGQLFATADPSRVVFVSGGAWNCPWRVFLVVVAPASAKVLTEGACGRIEISPGRQQLAVITSQTCEGRGCGDERLVIFDAVAGEPQFDSGVTPGYTDMYWENDQKLTFRYHDRSDDQEQRHYYKVISAHVDGTRWRWTNAAPSPTPRVPAVDIGYDQSIEVKRDEPATGIVRFDAKDVFGTPPEEYRADAPRVFRAGDRVVIVRRLVEKDPAPSVNPRRRDQVAVLKLREAK